MTTFEVTHTSGGARRGLLRLPGGLVVETPCLLGHTQRGAPLHLTPDILASLPSEAKLLGVAPLAFGGGDASVVSAAGGLSPFAGLPGCVLVAVPRTPRCFDGGASKPNDAGLAVGGLGGARRVTPTAYADTLASLRCHAAVALADEPDWAEAAAEPKGGSGSGGGGTKRLCTANGRSARWLAELSLAFAARPELAETTGLWASLGGGGQVASRRDAAVSALDAHDAASISTNCGAAGVPLAGVSLAGLHCGEAPADRRALIAASLSPLLLRPPSPRAAPRRAAPPLHLLPRHVSGCAAPHEVLAAAGGGCDVFDGSHAHGATLAGCALVFDLRPPSAPLCADAAPPERRGAGDGSDGFRLPLRSPCFARDARPILPGCPCVACARPHSRAYLHHLLACHEMLADVLLDAHNVTHMARFTQALRDAIAADTFDAFAAFHASAAKRRREDAAAVCAAED